MSQPILPVVQEEISGSGALFDLQQAISDMINQLNNDSTVSTDFVTYNPTTSVVSTKPADFSSEETYLENVLEELDDAGVLSDGDLVVVADSGALSGGYGYGGATWSPPGSSKTYSASRVLYTPSEPAVLDGIEIFNNLAIHEAAHALTDRSIDEEGIDADHASGTYDIESGLFFDNARDVSPFATAYTYTSGGAVDTSFPGGSTGVSR